MIKLKRTAAALVAAFSLAAPAKASIEYFTPGQLERAGVHEGIARGLDALGVPVVNGISTPALCGDTDSEYYTLAMYNRRHNFIIICPQNMTENWQFIESVTHEAAHVVQDCRSGIETNTLYPGDDKYLVGLWKALPLKKQETIANAYPEDKWAVEVEAFYFEDKPQAVAEGIREICF